MEVRLNREWVPILPWWRRVYLRVLASQRSAGEFEVSTQCEAVSIQRISVLVPGVSEWWMYGNIYVPQMRTYPPRVALIVLNFAGI